MNYQEAHRAADTADETLHHLIITYGDELKRIAYLYVNDLAQAEDIVQEAFLSCYKNLHRFNHQSTYKTWLYRITINKCKDYRKKWSYRNIFYKAQAEVYQKEVAHSPHNDYEDLERREEIIASIAALPAKYKEVLIFYYYQDMSMKEISEITGIKINTIKSRMTRGRTLLKDELQRRGFDFG